MPHAPTRRRRPRRPWLLFLSVALVALSSVPVEAAPAADPAAPPAAAPPPLTGDPCQRQASLPGREKEQAQRALGVGNAALGNGEYLKALTCFEEAFRHFSSPKLHFNIAQALFELGRLVGALDHYERFLRAFKRDAHPQNWDIATKRIFVLQGRTATLQIQINVPHAEVSLDGASIGRSPFLRPFRVMPGPHVIVVTRPGYEKEVIQRKLSAGDNVTQRVTLLTESAAVARRERFRKLAEERRRIQRRLQLAREEARQREASRRRAMRISGWSLIGTGAALLATGGALWIASYVDSQVVEDADGMYSAVRSRDERTKIEAPLAWAAGITGALVAGGGGVLIWLSQRRAEQPAPAKPAPEIPTAPAVEILPTSGPGQVGLGLSLRF